MSEVGEDIEDVIENPKVFCTGFFLPLVARRLTLPRPDFCQLGSEVDQASLLLGSVVLFHFLELVSRCLLLSNMKQYQSM